MPEIIKFHNLLLGINIRRQKRRQLFNLLADENIGTRPFFYPMHLQPVFIKMGLFANECHPHSERLAEKGFYLPSGLAISDENIRYVANKVKSILKNKDPKIFAVQNVIV